MVARIELAEVQTSSILIQSLDIFVEPYVLASDSRCTLRFEDDLLYRILGNEVTARCLALDQET